MEVTINSISSTGKGVAVITKDGYNRSVFVKDGVPGDVLEVEITLTKKIYYEAKIVKIITPSVHRIKPVCEHFGVCGACDFLHVDYETQIEEKEKQLRNFLEKADFSVKNIEVIESPEKLNYRARLRVQYKDSKACFYAKKSNELIPINNCNLIKEELNEVFKKPLGTDGEKRYAYDYENKKIVSEYENILCSYYIDDLKLLFSPIGFVQNNLLLNEKMVKFVVENTVGDKVLDLYAGNGNFSLALAKKSSKVTAVEGNRLSHGLLLKNSIINNITNIKAIRSDANIYSANGYDTVILDPPRTGAENLSRINANTIIYVSCNPRQLVKDLKQLTNYNITKVALFDMFAQTVHFETVVVLKKKN